MSLCSIFFTSWTIWANSAADDSGRAVFSIRTIAGSWTPSGLGRVPKNEIAWDTGSREKASETVGSEQLQHTLVQNALKLEGFPVHRSSPGRMRVKGQSAAPRA
jgi:hypothetical protein